ncbi:MAG: glycerate kinase [Silvanigrellales bacterium]|jgi:glycerate kinase|nr:glycerate kinase [Silvanigrellales bacterium]
MRVVLALDKFKGTFTARQACELLAEGIRHRNPKIEVIIRPMADGGDGTAAILTDALGLEGMRVSVPDLLGKMTEVQVHWQNTRRLALVESADVIGVARAMARHHSLQRAHSGGLGRLLLRAFDLRPQEIWIGVGGTMTADAGWGLAHTLGLRALDAHGNVVEPALANVPLIDHFVAQDVPEFFRKTRIVALCDVNAPAQGAAVSLASFLPQKGASPADADLIQKQVTTLWTHLRKVNPQLSSLEDAYTGAGGGLVLGLQAVFPQLRLELGARKVAQATALGPSLQAADFAVCGEGRFDDSTFYGKAAAVVSQLGSEHQARIVGVFGSIAMQGAAREGARTRLGAETLHALFDEGQAHLSLQELSKASRARFVEIGLRIAHDAECASR